MTTHHEQTKAPTTLRTRPRAVSLTEDADVCQSNMPTYRFGSPVIGSRTAWNRRSCSSSWTKVSTWPHREVTEQALVECSGRESPEEPGHAAVEPRLLRIVVSPPDDHRPRSGSGPVISQPSSFAFHPLPQGRTRSAPSATPGTPPSMAHNSPEPHGMTSDRFLPAVLGRKGRKDDQVINTAAAVDSHEVAVVGGERGAQVSVDLCPTDLLVRTHSLCKIRCRASTSIQLATRQHESRVRPQSAHQLRSTRTGGCGTTPCRSQSTAPAPHSP